MVCLTFGVIQRFQQSLTVPIIAVFTKYDCSKVNVEMKLVDEGEEYSSDLIEEKAEESFQEYLDIIAGRPKHIGLASKTALTGGVCIY